MCSLILIVFNHLAPGLFDLKYTDNVSDVHSVELSENYCIP